MNRRGFTLIEVLMVIAIILILASAIAWAVGGLVGGSYKDKTISLFRKIEIAMQAYYDDFGAYPPDGFDSPVYDMVDDEVQLRGSQCLVHFLAWKYGEKGQKSFPDGLMKQVKGAAHEGGKSKWVPVHGGRPYLDLKKDDYGDGKFPEILDAWLNPIHYDNTDDNAGGEVTWQDDPDEQYHTPRVYDHADPDPRRGGQPSSAYDIWSHGPDGHSENPTAKDDLQRKDTNEE